MMKKDYKMRRQIEMELSGRCATCPLQGRFPEVCRIHRQQMIRKTSHGLSCSHNGWVCWGMRIATGAGVGLAGAVAGLAVVPVFGAKALLGHMIGYQIAGAASATGASVNVAMKIKHKEHGPTRRRVGHRSDLRRRHARLPDTLS